MVIIEDPADAEKKKKKISMELLELLKVDPDIGILL
jgi:hypothetical protein